MKSNLHRLYLILGCVCVFLWSCSAFPVHPDGLDNDGQLEKWRTVIGALVAVALVICVVVVSVQCLCCDIKPRRPAFNQDRSQSLTPVRENGAASTEFTIFPPVGSQQLVDPRNDDDVKFEPLPDIHPRRQNSVPTNQKPRPATFSNVVTKGLSLRDWFEDPHSNFPRKQLQYVRELGSGWFGQVVEGEAYGIVPTQRKTKVVVKILMEGANTTDQMYFLHEVKPFRDLDHPNVLKLLGKCLESDPFLIILEHCAFKDLKSYLIHHRTEAESLFNQNLLLRMVCNVAAGLLHAHEHGFVLTDLAARNCVVSSDLVVKIGDYGNSIELYKDDYYCAGGIAVPVRWCAPETLRCTETIMETREVTQEANIWSFGVVLWEILEFGKLPYIELSDDELIQKVIIDRTEVLKRPLTPYNHVNRLYQIIQLCQLSPTNRPSMDKIHAMLSYLYAYKMESSDSAAEFEIRWNQLQPRRPLPKASSSYAGGHVADLSSSPYNGDSIFARETSSSPNLSLSYDSDFGHPIIISPSLQNLRGSIDDLRIEEGGRRNDLATLSTDSYYAAVGSALNPYEQDSRTESAMSFLDPSLHSVANHDAPSLSSSTDISNKVLEERHSSTSSKEVSPFTREVREVIRKLDQDLDEACPSLVDALPTSSLDGSLDPMAASEDTRVDNSLFGDESYLNSIGSEVEFDSLTHDISGVVADTLEKVKEGSEEDDDDDLSWRKIVETSNEQSGEITRIIREKSQSVQDFLKLTVIDSESGSDSDGVPNKNELAASGGEGDAGSPKALRRQVQVRRRQSADDILLDIRGEEGRGTGGSGGGGAVVFANLGDGLTQLHAVNGPVPVSLFEPVHVDAALPPGSIRSSHSSDGSISCDARTDSPGVVPVHHSLDRLANELVTDSLFRALPEVLSSRYNTAACAMAGDWTLDHSFGTVDTFLSPLNTHRRVPPIVVHEAGDPLEESDCEEEPLTHGPKSGLNFRFVFDSLDDNDDDSATEKSKDTSVIYSETSATEIPSRSTNADPLVTSPGSRTSTPRSKPSNEYALSFADDCSFELDVFGTDSETQVPLPECSAFSETWHDTTSGSCPDGGAAASASITDGVWLGILPAQNEAMPFVGLSDNPSQIYTGVVDDDALSTIVGNGSNLFTELHKEKFLANQNFPCDEALVSSNVENFKPSHSFVADACSKNSASDRLVPPNTSRSIVEEDHLSNGTVSSDSFLTEEQAGKLIDFEEFFTDGGLTVLTRPGSNVCEVKESPEVMGEIQSLSIISKGVNSDVYDQIPGTNTEDNRHSVGGNMDGELTMERRSVSTPDIVIDSAFAYLCAAASGPDDLWNANASDGGESLLDFKSVVGGPLSERCSTASASPTLLRNDSNECHRTSSSESTTTDETGPDRTTSLDEGFEPSESNESCPDSEAVSSSSQLDPMALNHSTEVIRAEGSQQLGSSSSLYSPDEDCVMLVDLETNEAVLLDRPKSKLTFAQDAWEKSSNEANSEDDLSSISLAFPKNGDSGASTTKEASTSNDLEDDVLDEDCGESLTTASKSDEAFEPFDGESNHDATRSSGGGQPFESGSSSEDTSTSVSPSHSKDSDNSIASDWHFVSREVQKTERVFIDKSSSSEDRPDIECNAHTMEEAPQELTPELLFLMQLTSKMEKLGLKSHDDAIERRSLPITKSSNKSSSMGGGNLSSNEGPDGCIPPTPSPTNGPTAISSERLLSPQWETSTDSSSSPSGCHSPSSASSTSGEFDCAKEFKFESFKTPEVIADGDENDDDDDEEETEEDQADDEGGYGDDEGEDEDSLVDSFKASTWDKDATPTKGLLRSPDKQYQSEGKKTVSFKVQKRSVIYEYPKEEVEDEDVYDPRGSHSVWTYHMYNPELDYSRYADWDLEEGAPENVEVEEYDDEGSSESSSDFMGQPRNPDQAHALYKLSDIPDEDLASDYSSEGGSASYYAHHDSFDFASYLDHYNGSPLFSGVPAKNQDDEDFWLETILNSSDFFVSGTDCPFVFDGEGGEEGKGLPQWALSPDTFNMYVDMQNGSEFVNGSNPRYELETGHYGDYVEEEDEDDNGEPAQYEREGHVSRMGEYKEVDAEEEEPLDDGKDDGVGPWDEADSGESAESVAMETDSTDENLEVKTDKVTNLINNNLLPSVVSDRPKTSNDMKPSTPRINGTESRSDDDDVGTTDWNGSSSKSTEDIINRGSSQLETAA